MCVQDRYLIFDPRKGLSLINIKKAIGTGQVINHIYDFDTYMMYHVQGSNNRSMQALMTRRDLRGPNF
jgi:hypothetical protein